MTRTRSQSQTKQQPAGDGRTLLPFVLGTFPFTQVGPHTSYWLLGAALFVSGMGMDATMMPAMSAAYQALRRAAVARATTALTIIQRVGASIRTAVLAVVLQHQLTSRIPAAGAGLGATENIPPAAKAHVAPGIGAAFGHAF